MKDTKARAVAIPAREAEELSCAGAVFFASLLHAPSMGAKRVRSHTPGSLFRISQAAYVFVYAGQQYLRSSSGQSGPLLLGSEETSLAGPNGRLGAI